MALRYQPDDLMDIDVTPSSQRLPSALNSPIGRAAGIIVLAFLLFWLLGPNLSTGHPFTKPPELVLTGQSTTRLHPGASVRLGQVTIGEVVQAGSELSEAFVRIRLQETWMDRLTTAHQFAVETPGLFSSGPAFVSVTAPDGATSTQALPIQRCSTISLQDSSFELPETANVSLSWIIPGVVVVVAVGFVLMSKAAARFLLTATIAGAIGAAVWLLWNHGAIDPSSMERTLDGSSRLIQQITPTPQDVSLNVRLMTDVG